MHTSSKIDREYSHLVLPPQSLLKNYPFKTKNEIYNKLKIALISILSITPYCPDICCGCSGPDRTIYDIIRGNVWFHQLSL